ncbi:MAG: hypothetical protein A2201_11480 [Alicyclobacillus sp. RIFOXYA1_FULL_53_8]|nr:MAG: hypothetical protein A2201_11480 [Alicyclobacillus sp. RIFOXYA1_FULL_53_8]
MFDGALLISLREGVEISLMIGIIISYLRKLGRNDGVKYVWLGTLLAALLTTGIGIAIYRVTGSGAEWAYQTYLEAAVMLLAVVMLSYMTIWMKQNSARLSKDMHTKIEGLLNQRGVIGLTLLAFLTIIREGIETVMFLLGLTFQHAGGGGPVLMGAVLGFALSSLVGVAIYKGTYHVNLSKFFQVMGSLLILVAAGLLASAIGSLIEAHLLQPIHYLFNLTNYLSVDSTLGIILHALLGYSDHPSILQVGAWVLYLAIAFTLYNRKRAIKPRRRTDSVIL